MFELGLVIAPKWNTISLKRSHTYGMDLYASVKTEQEKPKLIPRDIIGFTKIFICCNCMLFFADIARRSPDDG